MPLLFEYSKGDFAGTEEIDDDGIFISPIQQWIDGACEILDFAWKKKFMAEDLYPHEQSGLLKLMVFLMLEYLVMMVHELCQWFL